MIWNESNIFMRETQLSSAKRFFGRSGQFLIKKGLLKNETKFPTQSTTNSKLIQQVLKKTYLPIQCRVVIITLNQPK